MVSLPIFGMICGTGRLSSELDLGGFITSISRWTGKWGS